MQRQQSVKLPLSLLPLKAIHVQPFFEPLLTLYVPLPCKLLRSEWSPQSDDHAEGKGQEAHYHGTRVLEKE